jgi:hypothetical protein
MLRNMLPITRQGMTHKSASVGYLDKCVYTRILLLAPDVVHLSVPVLSLSICNANQAIKTRFTCKIL